MCRDKDQYGLCDGPYKRSLQRPAALCIQCPLSTRADFGAIQWAAALERRVRRSGRRIWAQSGTADYGRKRTIGCIGPQAQCGNWRHCARARIRMLSFWRFSLPVRLFPRPSTLGASQSTSRATSSAAIANAIAQTHARPGQTSLATWAGITGLPPLPMVPQPFKRGSEIFRRRFARQPRST